MTNIFQGYDNSLPPQYPYIDETPTDPPSNYFAYRGEGEARGEEGCFTRPMSGQCKFHSSEKNLVLTG